MLMKRLRRAVPHVLGILLWAGALHAGTIHVANFSVSGHDRAYGMAVDTDTSRGNRVYIAGQTWNGSDSTMDMLILKYDYSGTLIASTTFRFAIGSDDCARSCAVDRDGNLLVTGYSREGSFTRCVTLKYGYAPGAAFPAPVSRDIMDASGNSLAITPDSEILVAGMSFPAAGGPGTGYVAKYNSAFTAMVASGTFGSGGSTTTLEGITTSGQYAYVTGMEASGAEKRMRLWRFDASQTAFSRTSALVQNDMKAGYAVALDTAGFVYVAGDSAGQQCMVKKYDTALVMQSSFSISGFTTESSGRSAFISPSNKLYAAGISAMPWPARTFGLELDAALSTCAYRTIASSPTVSAAPLTPCATDFFFCAATSSDTIQLYKTYYDAAPGKISDLSYSFISRDDFSTVGRLSWSTPAGDGLSGTLSPGSSYVIQHSTAADGQWSYWTAISTHGVAPGTVVSELCGTGRNNPHFFRICTVNAAQISSPVSNVIVVNDVNIPPAAVTDLAGGIFLKDANGDVRGRLSWTMPGDDGWTCSMSSPTLTVYRSSSPYGYWNWDQEYMLYQEFTPGTTWNMLLENMVARGTTAYFRIRIQDHGGHYSGLSSTASISAYNPPPGAVDDLSASIIEAFVSSATVRLFWTMPGDDGYTGVLSTGARVMVGYYHDGMGAWDTSRIFFTTGSIQAGALWSYDYQGIAQNTTCYFRVQIDDSWNDSAGFSNTATARYPPEDLIPPAAVTDLSIRSLGRFSFYEEFELSWTMPGDDGNTGLFDGEYWIEGSGDGQNYWAAYSTRTVNGIAPGTKMTEMFQLSYNTTNYYRVIVCDGVNVSTPSNATFYFTRNTPPAQITDLQAHLKERAGSMTRVALTWSMPGDDGWDIDLGTSTYEIMYSTYSGASAGHWYAEMAVSTYPITAGALWSCQAADIPQNQDRYYRIRVRDGFGQYSSWSQSAFVCDTNTPPARITDLRVSYEDVYGSSATVRLSWTMPGDDGYVGTISTSSSMVVRYRLGEFGTPQLRYTNLGAAVAPYGTASVLMDNISAAGTYYYEVMAYDNTGNAAGMSDPAHIRFPIPDTAGPGEVNDLTVASRVRSGSMVNATLAWTLPGDDGYAGTFSAGSHFTVEVTTDAGGVWTPWSGNILIGGELANTATGYTVWGLPQNTTNYIRVNVYDSYKGDADLNKSTSNVTAVYEENLPPAAITDLLLSLGERSGQYTRFNMSWTQPGEDGMSGLLTGEYRILMSTTGGEPWEAMAPAEITNGVPGTKTSRYTMLTQNVTHYIRVYTYDGEYESGASNTAALCDTNTPPARITDLRVSYEDVYGSSATVRLSWTMPGDDGYVGTISTSSSMVVRYRLGEFGTPQLRYTNLGAAVAPYGTASVLMDNISAAGTYYYEVMAYDNTGNAAGMSDPAHIRFPIPDTAGPGEVNDLTVASRVRSGSMVNATLAWTLPGDDGYAGTFSAGSHFTVEVTTDAGGVWTPWSGNILIGGELANTATGYTVWGLPQNTTNYIRVNVYDSYKGDADLNKSTSNVTAVYEENLPPAPVTSLAVSVAGRNAAVSRPRLEWAMPGDDGMTQPLENGSVFTVRFATSPAGLWQTLVVVSTSGVTPGTRVRYDAYTGVAQNTTFYFRIVVTDAGNNSSLEAGSNMAALYDDTVAPAPVQDLAVTVTGVSGNRYGVALAWTMPGNNGLIGTLYTGSRYRIEYSTSPTTAWQYVVNESTGGIVPGSPAGAACGNLATGVIHYLRVAVVDESGNASTSNIQSVYVPVQEIPERVEFDAASMTVIRGEMTGVPLKLRLTDRNRKTVPAISAVTVTLSGRIPASYANGTPIPPGFDTAALFARSASTAPAELITQITFAPGQSEASFYYVTNATAPMTLIQATGTITASVMASVNVTVLSYAVSDTRIHKGDYAAQRSVAVYPGENTFIDFNSGDYCLDWHVFVSTSTDRSFPLWTFSGSGFPAPGQVTWNGMASYFDPALGSWRNELLPGGTYYIGIQLGNGAGVMDTSLKAFILSSDISGRVVTQQGAGIAGVSISAYGPVSSYTRSDSQGYFKVGGLRQGTYNLKCAKEGYPAVTVSPVVAGSTRTVEMIRPSYVKINARRPVSDELTDDDQWSSLQIISSDTSRAPYLTYLHFAVDVSTSDNGQYSYDQSKPVSEVENTEANVYEGGKWNILEVLPGTYTVRGELAGYEPFEQAGFVVLSGTVTEISSVQFTRKKSVKGIVRISDACTMISGLSVSIEVSVPGGASFWVPANIPQGASSAAWSVTGLSQGAYAVSANASGYRRSSTTVTVGLAETAQAPDIELACDGVLSGSITVEGDSTDASLGIGGDPFTLRLHAWSPDNYSYNGTSIQVARSTSSASASFSITLKDGTYWIQTGLSGFELEGAVGYNGVRAAGADGSGTVALKLKRYAGTLRCRWVVPQNDFGKLRITVSGPNTSVTDADTSSLGTYGVSLDTATGIMTVPHLAGGFYQVGGYFTGTGMQKTRSAMITAGAVREIEIDLSAATYAVSGTVSVSASNPPLGFDTIQALAQAAPQHNYCFINGESTTSFRVRLIEYSRRDASAKAAITSQDKTALINEDGTFVIPGVVPGVYVMRVDPLELDGEPDNGRETSACERVILVNCDRAGESIEISRGISVSGQVILPSGDQVTRAMPVMIFNAKQFEVASAANGQWNDRVGTCSANFVNSSSASYRFNGLVPGDYVIAVEDGAYWDTVRNVNVPRRYANTSLKVKVGSSDLADQNIVLRKGGRIVFKLRDTDSGTVIIPRNRGTMLPADYRMKAAARPWIEGGYGEYSSDYADLDAFEINYLPEGVYDLQLAQSSYAGAAGTAAGGSAGSKVSYALKTVSGLKVTAGGAIDIGTIDIRQGITVNGTIKDRNGNGIPNIPVIALPSLSKEWSEDMRAFTDVNGAYSIMGCDPGYPYYDIIACPRIDPSRFGASFFYGAGGVTYGEKARTMRRIADGETVDFVLDEALGEVRGVVTAQDGGQFQNPKDAEMPTARVYLQLANTFPRTDPLGDIVADTQLDGSFQIETLSPGTYRMVVLSGGYASFSSTITIGSSAYDCGSVVLRRGAKIAGSVTMPDGSNPSTADIDSVVAATDNFSEILTGSLSLSGDTTIAGYEINGLSSDTNYNLMFVTRSGELALAAENYGVPYSTYCAANVNLVFKLNAPAVFGRALKDGPAFTITFELTGALRKLVADDDDVSKLVAIVSGQGTLSNGYIAPNRKTITCRYAPAANEDRFTLLLDVYAAATDPETGSAFRVRQEFQYHAGVVARNKIKMNNLQGGKVTLDGDASNVLFAPGSFDGASSTSTFYIDFACSRSSSVLISGSPSAPVKAVKAVVSGAPGSYPTELYRAMSFASSSGIDPMSAFYDVMLPAGVARSLKKDATLTLQYDAGANPADLNIYYYDPVNNVYLLENRGRSVDAVARTVSVGVGHASVFVILNANGAVIQGMPYSGQLFAYNYPNPFDLSIKTVALNNASLAQQSQAIAGTMIHYGLPQGLSGDVEIRIYNVAGELVRTIRDGARSGGSHYYTEWNGANDSGAKVASGVYIARFSVNGREKYFKMAVIR